jgi:hypothetical protein
VCGAHGSQVVRVGGILHTYRHRCDGGHVDVADYTQWREVFDSLAPTRTSYNSMMG